jgi:hypothetical protein
MRTMSLPQSGHEQNRARAEVDSAEELTIPFESEREVEKVGVVMAHSFIF